MLASKTVAGRDFSAPGKWQTFSLDFKEGKQASVFRTYWTGKADIEMDHITLKTGNQTATTVGASDVQRLGDRVDVRTYAYGNYNRNKVLRERQQGHPFWFYENGMFYGDSTVASRSLAGFEFLRSGAKVATAWGFDATQANPYNDFDGGHKD